MACRAVAAAARHSARLVASKRQALAPCLEASCSGRGRAQVRAARCCSAAAASEAVTVEAGAAPAPPLCERQPQHEASLGTVLQWRDEAAAAAEAVAARWHGPDDPSAEDLRVRQGGAAGAAAVATAVVGLRLYCSSPVGAPRAAERGRARAVRVRVARFEKRHSPGPPPSPPRPSCHGCWTTLSRPCPPPARRSGRTRRGGSWSTAATAAAARPRPLACGCESHSTRSVRACMGWLGGKGGGQCRRAANAFCSLLAGRAAAAR